jgi:leucyl/phenylalanyl-tRNA---protein transferase
MPTEPPPTPWVFPDPTESDDDLIAIGADLQPGTILSAYRLGLFPMPVGDGLRVAWWSPVRRGVLPVDGMRVTRSLRQSVRRYRTTVDTAFDEVIERCADPSREGGWIDDGILAAYSTLHTLGWAHSVEVWRGTRLVGGLYGVAIGGLFAGESMFHQARDASKVALVTLVDLLSDGEPHRVLDVQWATPHLRTLGVVDISREEYLRSLGRALAAPLPAPWR